ncbi:MAG: tyrosine recombinase [Kiritimatiellaeota bacterium]|nr:tyrosine recombinase [Kiritimatiellota bacterium]
MRRQAAQFLDSIAYERGLSEHTRAAYERDLSFFFLFLEEACGVSAFEAVTRGHVAAFLLHGKRQGLAIATRMRRLVAIKVFFSYLLAEGRLRQNVTAAITARRHGRVLPRTLTEGDVAALLDSVRGGGAFDVRDRCMLELFYASGLRVSEVTGLRIGDVRVDEAVVRCFGKGSRERVVPVGAEACAWLGRYLAEARPTFARRSGDAVSLFLTRLGRPFTRQGVFDMLVKRAHAAGIMKDVSPHVLRHCFATHLLAHGVQIRAIQEMLGHADIATTQIYTHVDDTEVLRAHTQFHPRSRRE